MSERVLSNTGQAATVFVEAVPPRPPPPPPPPPPTYATLDGAGATRCYGRR